MEWHHQQAVALAAAEMKAAAAAEARGSARDPSSPPTPRSSSAPAEVPAGREAPLLFEDRFADREALPKGVTFAPAEVPTAGSGGGAPWGPVPLDDDAEMRDGERDADELAGNQHGGEPDGASGTHTPVWPPADATLAQLEGWLDSLRKLPADEGILSRQDLLCQRVHELRMPLPAPPPSPSPSS